MREKEFRQRGSPRAISSSNRDYFRHAAPEPKVLKVIGDESKAKGTDGLTSEQIDQVIKETRNLRRKSKRK